MPSRYPTLRISPLTGLNLRDDPYNLKTGDLQSCQNVICNNDGSISRCKGYRKIVESLDEEVSCIHSLHLWNRYDGSYEVILIGDDRLYSLTGLPQDPSIKKLYSGLSTGKKTRFVSYNDFLFFGNGFDENKVIIPYYAHKFYGTHEETVDATDLDTVKALYNALKATYNSHLSDTNIHLKADTSNVVTSSDLAPGDTLSTAISRVNELKTKFNSHVDASKVHARDDTYHEASVANASDLSTCVALINALKYVYNAHARSARVKGWNIIAPSSAMNCASTGTGSSKQSGTYRYCYTYYDAYNGVESPPSPITTYTSTSASHVSITNLERSTDPYVTHCRIYRTFVNGGVFYRVMELALDAISAQDAVTDAQLGAPLMTENNTSVPPTSIFCLHKDRIYMAGDYSNPFRLYFTEPTAPHMFRLDTNYQDFDVGITGIASLPTGLLIFEKHKTWLWLNPPFGSPPIVLSSVVGCSNMESIALVEGAIVFRDVSGRVGALDTPVVWQGYRGVYASNGCVPICLSEFINKEYVTRRLNSAVTVFNSLNNQLIAMVGE